MAKERAERGAGERVRATLAPGSRARASVVAALAPLLAGSEGPPAVAPLPWTVACDVVGIGPEAARGWADRGEEPALVRARAEGVALCVRRACGEGPDARQWSWLAERLAPRALHLPHRVTGLAAEDGGAPIATAALVVTLADARAGARDDYAGPLPVLPATRR